jgi:ABC-2 type transport system ATP-binding protein
VADELAIECRGLSKTYRDFWGRARHPALNGIDLVVARGESHALLGPNGSGKTTALRVLLGLLRPSAGEVRLFGRPPQDVAVRRRVGFLPEQSALHGFLRCQETLVLYAQIYGLSRAERTRRAGELLERVELAPAARKRVRELSHGMRRRLALAVALVGSPDLLVLDEPTQGMDPLVREGVLDLLRGTVKDGGTLLVTSHLLGDVGGIATRATLLAAGEVKRRGGLDAMLTRERSRSYRVRGDSALDGVVRGAVEGAGGELEHAGATQCTIEELFLETYAEPEPPTPGESPG